MQQAVGVEGVPDAAVLRHPHVEPGPSLGGAGADHGAVLSRLLGGRAVFAGDVVDDVLALGRHVGVELERLEMDLGLDPLGPEPVQRRGQAAEADDAPGADDVGDEVDVEGAGHGGRARARDAGYGPPTA